jgi:hypothetical protein
MTLQRMLFMRDTIGKKLFVHLENFCANKDPRFDEENVWHIHYALLEHKRLFHPSLSGVRLRMSESQGISNVRLTNLIYNLYFKLVSMKNDPDPILFLTLDTIVNLLKNFPDLAISMHAAKYLRLMNFLFLHKVDNSLSSYVQAEKLLKVMSYLQSRSMWSVMLKNHKESLMYMAPEYHPHYIRLKSKI